MHQGASCNAHTLDINVVINWQLSKQGASITWAQESTHSGQVFFWSYPLVTRFQMVAGLSLIFFKIHMKYVVFLWRTIRILFLNRPRTRRIQPAIIGREDSCFCFFSQWSRVGHALRLIFMLWLVKIWQVSSCAKFMQHLESCLL